MRATLRGNVHVRMDGQALYEASMSSCDVHLSTHSDLPPSQPPSLGDCQFRSKPTLYVICTHRSSSLGDHLPGGRNITDQEDRWMIGEVLHVCDQLGSTLAFHCSLKSLRGLPCHSRRNTVLFRSIWTCIEGDDLPVQKSIPLPVLRDQLHVVIGVILQVEFGISHRRVGNHRDVSHSRFRSRVSIGYAAQCVLWRWE
jgi:hypothetical protein